MVNIDTLHIENFKSIKSLNVKFNKINAILGPNNAGKSNIMRALSIVLGETWPSIRSIDDNDYFNRDINNTIKIQVMFDNYFEDEKSQKHIYGFRFECDKYDAKFLALDATGQPLMYNTGTAVRVSSDMREEVPLIYVDVDRQSSQQVMATQWTLYGKILKFLASKIPERNKKQFKDNVLNAFKSEIFDIVPGNDLKYLEEILNKTVNKHTGLDLELRLDILDPVDAIKNVRPYFIAGKIAGEYDPEEMGAGTQSALSVAIARAYGDIVKKNVIFAIEEPELHLHPQACRTFYNNLKALSQNEVQVIYTTHSQYFVDLSEFNSLYIVRKKNSQTTIKSASVSVLADINKNSFTTKFNEGVNQTLFADSVILVEGPADEIACKAMLEKIEFNINILNISVVACDGNANIIPVSKVLKALNIRTLGLVDVDPGNDTTLSRIMEIQDIIGENNVYVQIPDLEGLFKYPKKFTKTTASTFFEQYDGEVPDVYNKIKSRLLNDN